jgi:hypothetical protein
MMVVANSLIGLRIVLIYSVKLGTLLGPWLVNVAMLAVTCSLLRAVHAACLVEISLSNSLMAGSPQL